MSHNQNGVKCARLAMDCMRKVKTYVPAQPKVRPKGLRWEDGAGSSVIHQSDHDFVCGERMLICTSGVTVCQIPGDASIVEEPKPHWPRPLPDATSVFLRPFRWMDVTPLAHVTDLKDVVDADVSLSTADLVLVTCDNGPDYAPSQPVLQHLLGRLWRHYNNASLGWGRFLYAARAPYASALHFEAEQPWAQVPDLLAGRSLGWRFANGLDPNALDLPREEKLTNIMNSAMDEYTELLRHPDLGPRTGGKLWTVHQRHPKDKPLHDDVELLVDFYKATGAQLKDKRFSHLLDEAADFGFHMTTLPSYVKFQVCLDPEKMCAKCCNMRRRKLELDPSWDMRKLLAPLEFNGFRMPLPERQDRPWLGPEAAEDQQSPRRPKTSKEPVAKAGSKGGVERPRYTACPRKPSDAGEAQRYAKGLAGPCKSFVEVLREGRQQTAAGIPVKAGGEHVQTETITPCAAFGNCACWSTNPTAASRHRGRHHARVVKVGPCKAAPAPMPVDAAPTAGYSLGGCEPRPQPDKAARKRKDVAQGMVEEEGDEVALEAEVGQDERQSEEEQGSGEEVATGVGDDAAPAIASVAAAGDGDVEHGPPAAAVAGAAAAPRVQAVFPISFIQLPAAGTKLHLSSPSLPELALCRETCLETFRGQTVHVAGEWSDVWRKQSEGPAFSALCNKCFARLDAASQAAYSETGLQFQH